MRSIFVVICIATIWQTSECSLESLASAIDAAQSVCTKEAPIPLTILHQIAINEVEEDVNFNKFLMCMARQIGVENADGTYNVDFMKNHTAAMVGSHRLDYVYDDCIAFLDKHPPKNSDAKWWEMIKCYRRIVDPVLFYKLAESWLHLRS